MAPWDSRVLAHITSSSSCSSPGQWDGHRAQLPSCLGLPWSITGGSGSSVRGTAGCASRERGHAASKSAAKSSFRLWQPSCLSPPQRRAGSQLGLRLGIPMDQGRAGTGCVEAAHPSLFHPYPSPAPRTEPSRGFPSAAPALAPRARSRDPLSPPLGLLPRALALPRVPTSCLPSPQYPQRAFLSLNTQKSRSPFRGT